MPDGKAKTEKSKKAEAPQTPKGMRDIMGKDYFQFLGFFERASEIALYYGFAPIETPVLEYEDVFVRAAGETSDVVEKQLYNLKTKGGDRLALRPEGTASVMRAYIEHGMQSLPQPVMLYDYGTRYRHDKPQRGRYREFRQFDLEILGTEKSIADAIVIHGMVTILKDVGVANINLEINSIGDKDCRPNFRRELTSYYKKNLNKVCRDCVRRFRTNPLRLLDCKNPECQEVKRGAPEPISYLCEPCKRHFKEVLEYLEALGIEYNIQSKLVRGLDYYTRTVFEISVIPPVPAEGEEVPTPLSITSGGRYDYLGKELGSSKPIPAVGGSVGVDRVLEVPGVEDLAPRILKKPKVYFIQLGFEAKLKSLSIIELLRKARIPVLQALSKDSLGSQLAIAEKLKIPYTIIFGQQEVNEGAVILRDMENRSQRSIKIVDLAAEIKKFK